MSISIEQAILITTPAEALAAHCNPRWAACVKALGREPTGYEFCPWVQGKIREFLEETGNDEWIVLTVGIFDEWLFRERANLESTASPITNAKGAAENA